ncbi:MAG TPA: serine/threonine-protein kinase [Mycobacteriales bacterium]|nr:serine/threonine-protein kinase [Mycobacteriales bacterium]
MRLTELDEDDGEPVWDRPEGAELVAGYLAWERLGVGLRCETWLVWSTKLWYPAVLKLARPHQVTHPRAVRSLNREIAALTGNQHPCLPRLFTDGTTDPLPHIAVEYIDGPTLDEELDTNGPIGAAETASLAAQLLAGIIALHDRDLAHVDLKPENVVLRDGRPVLIDFGSVRRIGAPQPLGRPVGTAGYAAPELEACVPIAAGMDLYGLGTILFETLTGEPAFDAALPAACRPAPDVPSTIAAPMRTLVVGLLEPRPEDRPSAAETMRVLGTVASEPDARPWPDWVDDQLQDRFAARRYG